MDKPIVVTLGTGFANDKVEYVENDETKTRYGLCKQVDASFLQNPFRDLVSYMCNPEEDLLNQAYTSSEQKLAESIEALIQGGDVALTANKANGYQVNGIELEEILGDKYAEIREMKEIESFGQTIPVHSLDLTIQAILEGGVYR